MGAVMDYARIVRDDALLRAVLSTTREIQAAVLSQRGDPRELIERAEAALFRIGHDGGTAEMRSLEEVLHAEIDKLEELSRTDVGLTGTPSGFADLDALTGGFQPGNLIVLAARPSMGKSTLATNIAENAAIDHGVPVALFSLEMSETELAHRFIASQAKVSSDELRKGRVRGDRWPKVLNAVEKLASAPIFIDDSSDIGVLEMRAKARRLHSRQRARADRGGLPPARPRGRPQRQPRGAGGPDQPWAQDPRPRARDPGDRRVAALARRGEPQPAGPMLSDLRESGQLEQDADLVMFVYREDYYLKEESERPGEADMIIAKHRNGPIGSVALTFLPKYPRFASMYRDRSGDAPSAQNGHG